MVATGSVCLNSAVEPLRAIGSVSLSFLVGVVGAALRTAQRFPADFLPLELAHRRVGRFRSAGSRFQLAGSGSAV